MLIPHRSHPVVNSLATGAQSLEAGLDTLKSGTTQYVSGSKYTGRWCDTVCCRCRTASKRGCETVICIGKSGLRFLQESHS